MKVSCVGRLISVISLMISERIRQIYKDLSPVTAILKLLADTSIIDQHLFDLMDQNDIVKLAVKMVTQLNDMKVLLRGGGQTFFRAFINSELGLPEVAP